LSFTGAVAPAFVTHGYDFAACQSGGASGTFDVSPDGERFLLNVVTGESVSPVTVVLNWTAEIARGR
jgi:hypothetical protein